MSALMRYPVRDVRELMSPREPAPPVAAKRPAAGAVVTGGFASLMAWSFVGSAYMGLGSAGASALAAWLWLGGAGVIALATAVALLPFEPTPRGRGDADTM